MKTPSHLLRSVTALALASSCCLTACAAATSSLVLDPVGPPPARPTAISTQGRLVVFSAYSVHAPGLSDPDYLQRHTDYELVATDGRPIRNVVNQAGAWGKDPAGVGLEPGAYRIVARANGYGLVTVPVIVVAGRDTIVHLEGSASWSGAENPAGSHPVCLPDGQIVGWRAE
jgi:hypothetical protein